ncbi:hypothetical protein V1264_022627 [Littorina saxatilis]|uniref:Cyclic nucleotide-binding domain-containing protein n=1 Tax=Littorina saxatilis TaxID=31220 RepID=A0AAN9FY21_9CAEN
MCAGCLRVLSIKFHTTHAPPGDTLLHPGDILTSIYFIARGSVEILKGDTVMAILGKDDIFGEEDVLRKDSEGVGKSMYFVTSLSYCDINKIDLSDLKEIMQLYPEFAEQFMDHFQVTFNLQKGTLLHRRARQGKLEDETLRFIRQRRPRLQCKRRGTEDESRHRYSRSRESIKGSRDVREKGVEEDRVSILEFSPLAVTEGVTENDFHTNTQAKKTSGDKSKRDRKKEGRKLLSETKPLSVNKDNTSESLAAQPVFSPLASSGTTYKSSASTGQLWKFPPLDLEIRQHPEQGSITSLSDLETRVDSLTQRMQTFESDLFNTVDSILTILGHKPKVTRDQ